MTRAMYRRNQPTLFTRVVSAVLAVAFTLSLTGIATAVSSSAVADEVVAPASEAAVATSTVPAEAPATEAESSEEELAAVEEPAAVEELAAEAPKPVVATKVEVPKKAAGVKLVSPQAGVAPLAKPAPEASPGSLTLTALQGWNRGDQKWTKGNLGTYDEDEWVPFRMVVQNTGDLPAAAGDITAALDHYNANPVEAIMFDRTDSWRYYTQATQPGDEPPPPAGTNITPDPQDVGRLVKTAPNIVSTIPVNGFEVPGNSYAVIYFEGHLAMTVVQQAKWGIDGAGSYPGSSGHGYLEMEGVGKKTLPLPSVPVPGGSIEVYKFYDTNQDGVPDEDPLDLLSGWTMHLTGSGADWDVDVSAETTGTPPKAVFENLPPGTYTVTEDLKDGWGSAKTSVSGTVASNETKEVYIGNYLLTHTKTFELTLASPVPEADSFYVDYVLNGDEKSAGLKEVAGKSGVYDVEVEVDHGDVISAWTFYALADGVPFELGGDVRTEPITADITNPFTYVPVEISGHKYIDTDRDGLYPDMDDAPGIDWTIELYRGGEMVLDTQTDGNGAYSFTGLLPGSYTVREAEQPAAYIRVYPVDANEHVLTGLGSGQSETMADFVNQPKAAAIEIVKSGPSIAHVGDEVTYTFDITNMGALPLFPVTLTDTVFGDITDDVTPSLSGVTLQPNGQMGDSISVQYTTTVGADWDDPQENTAYVSGQSMFEKVWDDDDHVLDIINPAIDVEKSVSPTKVIDSGEVVYSYTLTNTGDATLTIDPYTDDKLGAVLPTPFILAPDESVETTMAAVITEPTDNVVTATGVDEIGGEKGTVEDSATARVDVDVSKVFELTLESAVPYADSYFVRYNLEGEAPVDVPLVGTSDPLVFVTDPALVFPYGTVIESWQFFAMVDGDEVALGDVAGPEELPIEKGEVSENRLPYDPVEIHGTKYIDADGDGADPVDADDVPGAGWGIKLYRGGVEITSTTTASDGTYSFTGLLPGAYLVQEVQQPDKYRVIYPETGEHALGGLENGNKVRQIDFVNQPLPSSISIEKDGPDLAHPGDEVTYTFVISNTGELPLSDLSLDDTVFGDITTEVVPSLAGLTLSPAGEEGDAITVTYTTTVSAAPDPLVNEATILAIDPFEVPRLDEDDHVLDIIDPVIDVTKSVDPTMVVDSDTVTYTVTVTNPSDDTTLTNVSVIDRIDGQVAHELATDMTLNPGESKPYTFSETISEPTTDTVTAKGIDELEKEVTDDATAHVAVKVTKVFEFTLAAPMPNADGYFVRYAVNGQVFDEPLVAGDDGIYTLERLFDYGTEIESWQFFAYYGQAEVALSEVGGPESLPVVGGEPTANSFTYTPGEVSGRKLIDANRDNDYQPEEPVGEGWTIELYRDGVLYDTAVTDDEGEFSFTGLLPGDYTLEEDVLDGYVMVYGPDGFTVPVQPIAGDEPSPGFVLRGADFLNQPKPSGISVVKTVDRPAVVVSDNGVVYTYTITNTGEVPLTDVTLTDDKIDGELLTGGALDPGESVEVTAAAQLSETTTNTATATGVDPFEETVDDQDDANVQVFDPSISIVKTADPVEIMAGETVTYTYVVTNTGDMDLTDVLITDDKLSGWTGPVGDLAIGESKTVTTTAELENNTLNTATVTGVYNEQFFGEDEEPYVLTGTVDDSDDALVEVFMPAEGDVSVTKTVDKATADPGDTLTYTITYAAEAAGADMFDITIVDDYDEEHVTVTDAGGGTVENGTITWFDAGPLPAGESRTLTYKVKVDEDMPLGTTTIRNTVVVTAPDDTDPDNNTDSTSTDVTVEEPFLPFTGSELLVTLLLAAAAAVAGLALRRSGRSAA